MKKLLATLVFFVLLVGAAAVFLPKLLSLENIEREVSVKVKAATGRDLAFSGVEFTLWPTLGLRLNDVAFSNAPWGKEKNMVTLKRLDVALAVRPLFARRVEVEKFILDAPVIHLEVKEDGAPNWVFGKKEETAPAATAESSVSAKDFDFKFGTVEIKNGSLSYADRKKGTTESIDGLDLTVNMPDLQSALALKGGLTYRKKRVDLEMNIQKPLDVAAGKASPGRIVVKTEDMQASVDGALSSQGVLVRGDIAAKISSLSGLAAWLQGGAPAPTPFQTVDFSSKAEVSESRLTLTGAKLSLDEIKAEGDVKAALSGKPDIYARLSMDKLNLDRFTGAEEKSAAGAGGTKQAEWDDTPMDFSGLKAVNLDAILQTRGFSVKGVEVGPSTLTVTIKDGALRFVSSAATLFEGQFSSDLSVNAASAVPALSFKFNTTGVQAKPVLATFADFKKLSGAADAQIAATATGNSQKAIINSLSGAGSVIFRNGALEGIDLVNIAKMLQSKLTDMGVGEGKTDFVELGGTFKIVNGVAQNDDLKMKGPLVQATGAGQVNLPQKSVNYRVVPVLTASSAVEGASGVKVPVDIKGPFHAIKVKPDYAAVVQQALENPEDIKATVKNVKEQGGAILQDIKKDPAKALDALLGGGF